MQFTQVKLQSADPERLARFYQEALDCEVGLPLTTLEQPAPRGVGNQDGDVAILVMSLPGSEGGPTLELISGSGLDGARGMLTFHVDDVDAATQRVVDAGGDFAGRVTEFMGPSGRLARFVFMTDPEGNVIDLFTLPE